MSALPQQKELTEWTALMIKFFPVKFTWLASKTKNVMLCLESEIIHTYTSVIRGGKSIFKISHQENVLETCDG